MKQDAEIYNKQKYKRYEKNDRLINYIWSVQVRMETGYAEEQPG